MVSREFRQFSLYISLSFIIIFKSPLCLQTGFLNSLCTVLAADWLPCYWAIYVQKARLWLLLHWPGLWLVEQGATAATWHFPEKGRADHPVGASDPLRSPRLCVLSPQFESTALVLHLHLADGKVQPLMCRHPHLIILMEISNSEYR